MHISITHKSIYNHTALCGSDKLRLERAFSLFDSDARVNLGEFTQIVRGAGVV